jgi:hypothetical protein
MPGGDNSHENNTLQISSYFAVLFNTFTLVNRIGQEINVTILGGK